MYAIQSEPISKRNDGTHIQITSKEAAAAQPLPGAYTLQNKKRQCDALYTADIADIHSGRRAAITYRTRHVKKGGAQGTLDATRAAPVKIYPAINSSREKESMNEKRSLGGRIRTMVHRAEKEWKNSGVVLWLWLLLR